MKRILAVVIPTIICVITMTTALGLTAHIRYNDWLAVSDHMEGSDYKGTSRMAGVLIDTATQAHDLVEVLPSKFKSGLGEYEWRTESTGDVLTFALYAREAPYVVWYRFGEVSVNVASMSLSQREDVLEAIEKSLDATESGFLTFGRGELSVLFSTAVTMTGYVTAFQWRGLINGLESFLYLFGFTDSLG